jgi:hypothetical protein
VPYDILAPALAGEVTSDTSMLAGGLKHDLLADQKESSAEKNSEHMKGFRLARSAAYPLIVVQHPNAATRHSAAHQTGEVQAPSPTTLYNSFKLHNHGSLDTPFFRVEARHFEQVHHSVACYCLSAALSVSRATLSYEDEFTWF